MKGKLALGVSLLVALLASLGGSASAQGEPQQSELSAGQQIANAITELDVERARALFDALPATNEALQFQRVRLAIYMSDCDSAEALARTLTPSPAVNSLADLAQSCARAVAGGDIIEDRDNGVWIRLQDDRDRPLVPRIVEVIVKARETVSRDLGVDLPRPLRLELVGDLFSLSAVSGLPVTAAETTGTVAVARWGRVTMISPRAAPQGYPWEDTLTHELTHLGLSRATRDFAPLWLQEGVAKGEETAWRPERPHDERASADAVARNALMMGSSVGVDALGPSIAMLPSADAASIAFAEVKSFMAYFRRSVGGPAFHLLLADLKGLGQSDPNAALLSVTGFDLQQWIARWKKWLVDLPEAERVITQVEDQVGAPMNDAFELARRARLGALFFEAERFRLAAQQFDKAVSYEPVHAALRFGAARAFLGAGDATRSRDALGDLAKVADLNGGWLALKGRFAGEDGDPSTATALFDLATAIDPFAPEVACEGRLPAELGGMPNDAFTSPLRGEICRNFAGTH